MKATHLLIRSMRLTLASALALAVLAGPALGQSAPKRPLDHDVYDAWNRIAQRALSPNGDWLAYTLTPGEGDVRLIIRSLDGGREMTVARGSAPSITRDSRFVIFTMSPMESVVDSLQKEGERGNDLPKDSLGIVALRSVFGSGGTIDLDFFKAARVKSFKVPEDGSGWVAYHLEKPAEPDSTSQGEGGERTGRARPGGGRRPGGMRPGGGGSDDEENGNGEEGTILVLRNLASGQETRIEHVTAYDFTTDGEWLVYTASNEDGTANGVYAVEPSGGATTNLLSGEGEYTDLTVMEESHQVAFLSDRDDHEADQPAFTLYHATVGEGEAMAMASLGSPGIREGWWVSDNGTLSFSDDGERLFFGTAPRPEPEPDEEDEIPEDERVVVDIWNWKDNLIQPMQLVQANRERSRTYMAWVPTSGGDVIQLGTTDVPDVTVGLEGNAHVAVGRSTLPYGWYVSHDGTYSDTYLIDVRTGEREMVIEKLRGSASLSTGATYLYWWDGFKKAYFTMDVDSREVVNVTKAIPHPVHNILDDHPDTPRSFGLTGWTEDDERVLISDQFDIWSVDPTGVDEARNLTEGVGRDTETRFRYARVSSEGGGGGGFRFGGGGGSSEFVPMDEDVLLSSFHLYTKEAGFYRDRFDRNRAPQHLVSGEYSYSTPQTAKDDEAVYLLTRQSFQDFPDLYVTDRDFDGMEKVTEANPQQSQYLWGSTELVEWLSTDGIPLQGFIIKPEDFDPSKKYPMMVYFYERSSDGIHRHRAPSPGSSVNLSFYASRGYVVFVPDVVYEIGHPGESALDCITPGILSLIGEGFVDPKRIGVQGHSWGGYQIAWMITRTNLFAAAEAGAPVSNMTSAYGGIRWQSGMNRQFQYEHTQSRIGGSLWDETLRYIENSPLFEADKIETPLLMLHNDEDGAVPWYQGIEMFMAMRRLQKPVWMANYNGEPHGVRRRPNQKDWAIRMQQFFDHYLMDAPAPVWMVKGVPAVLKGKAFGLELVGDTVRR